MARIAKKAEFQRRRFCSCSCGEAVRQVDDRERKWRDRWGFSICAHRSTERPDVIDDIMARIAAAAEAKSIAMHAP